jgi:hypothetical protein
VWVQDIGVYPVLFKEQGDEWSYHLGVELTGDEHMTARGTDGTDPVELGPPSSGPVSSRLLVRPHADGISCQVTGEGDIAPPEQVDPWRQSAEAAAYLLGRRDRIFTWEAIVGTSPRTFGLDRLGPLGAPQDIGPVRLTPGGICMREQVISERVESGFGIRHSFPVIASGRFSTYAWRRTEMVAGLRLRRSCALLSLFTGEVWIPRSHPHQVVDATGGLAVPAVFGLTPQKLGLPDEPEWRGEIPPGAAAFKVPAWIEQAWSALDADEGLARAVYAVYEGMRLEAEHPSLAHLTFVAAIEGFGERFVPDRRARGVAQKRFREALKTVMSTGETEQIAGLAYSLRSSTGHTASLFGSEKTYGYSYDSRLFDVGSDAVFDYMVLGDLRNASRRVVVKALGRSSER